MPIWELLPGHLSQPCVNSIWATTWPPFCITFLFRALSCLGGSQLKAVSVGFVSLELDRNIFSSSHWKKLWPLFMWNQKKGILKVSKNPVLMLNSSCLGLSTGMWDLPPQETAEKSVLKVGDLVESVGIQEFSPPALWPLVSETWIPIMSVCLSWVSCAWKTFPLPGEIIGAGIVVQGVSHGKMIKMEDLLSVSFLGQPPSLLCRLCHSTSAPAQQERLSGRNSRLQFHALWIKRVQVYTAILQGIYIFFIYFFHIDTSMFRNLQAWEYRKASSLDSENEASCFSCLCMGEEGKWRTYM